VNFLIFELRSY